MHGMVVTEKPPGGRCPAPRTRPEERESSAEELDAPDLPKLLCCAGLRLGGNTFISSSPPDSTFIFFKQLGNCFKEKF